MGLIQKVKSVFVHQERSAQHLGEIVAASANEQRQLNEISSKLDMLVAGSENEQRLLNEKLDATVVQLRLLNEKLNAFIANPDRRPPGWY
jgi:hypothetical protein